MIAWRLQEWAFGGLDQESLRFLDGLARQNGGSPCRRQLKPGTVLVRDYQGQRHTVTCMRFLASHWAADMHSFRFFSTKMNTPKAQLPRRRPNCRQPPLRQGARR
jgi:hypothetical protein